MEFILTEIERALDAGLYYIALQSTLTLPDICSVLESPTGNTGSVRQRYVTWYDTYAKEPDRYAMSGEVCYRLRCSSLHEGSTQHDQSPYSRVVFTLPDNVAWFHNNIFNDALNVDISTFCKNIITSVRKWEAQKKDDPVFQSNYAKLTKTYPTGLAPYITGVPIIT